MTDTLFAHPQQNDRQIAFWLIMIAILIFCMVMLGGVTRLTGSGLSMVEWDPIMGVIPPLNETEWQETFEKYKQYPEYQEINRGMSLDEFKTIFSFEYAHRVLGRLIGIAFLIPFLFFLFKKKIRRELIPTLIIMFILGGLQGLLGWFMVKSGLVKDPHVSQYRLAAHLIFAILIYGYILWTAWSLLSPKPGNLNVSGIRALRKHATLITVMVVIMIISGAFVAGTHAGAVYKTFPDMNGYLFPPDLFALEPWLSNFVENKTTIQFDHRLIAYLLIILIGSYWWRAQRRMLSGRGQLASNLLLLMLVIQVSLGIVTLLSEPTEPVQAGVSVTLAALHQGGALLLFTFALMMNHELRRGRYF